jgi:hypothetical protein
MRSRWFLAAALLSAAVHAQTSRIGEIEFFGYSGLDAAAVLKALPIHEGGQLSRSLKKERIKEAARKVTGIEPTDVAIVCCDAKGESMLYIGLGKSGGSFAYNPVPAGTSGFPQSITRLYRQTMNATMRAVLKGNASEDYSKGYSLSADAKLRSKQLEMRDYAVRNASLILEVLENSSRGQQRIVASELLGYAEQSERQFAALAHASRDANAEVRNNAVRALLVLAQSDPKVAAQIPAAEFIPMLHSGTWTDLNKAAGLLEPLSASRDPKLLAQLREQALGTLMEMARWRSPGHSYTAKMILGRIAGIEEKRLEEIVEKGEVQTILNAIKYR